MTIFQFIFTLLPLHFAFEPSTGVFADSALHINRTYALPDTRGQAWASPSMGSNDGVFPAGTYSVTVTAWGQAGPQGWPTVSLALSREGAPQAQLTLGSAEAQEYKTRMVFLDDNPTIYLRLTNDSYDPVTKGDTNAHIKKITFEPIEVDSIIVSWDANAEDDLAGYRLYRGYLSGRYDESVAVGLVTSYGMAVESGVEHYFVVTAYDESGNESGYSNEVMFFAPTEAPPTVRIIAPVSGQVVTSKTLRLVADITGDFTQARTAVVFFGMNGQWVFPVAGGRIEQVVEIDEENGIHQLRVQLVGEADVLAEAVVAVNVQIPDTTPPGPVRNLRIIKK